MRVDAVEEEVSIEVPNHYNNTSGDQAEHDGKSRSYPVHIPNRTYISQLGRRRRAFAVAPGFPSPALVYECDEWRQEFRQSSVPQVTSQFPAHAPAYECDKPRSSRTASEPTVRIRTGSPSQNRQPTSEPVARIRTGSPSYDNKSEECLLM